MVSLHGLLCQQRHKWKVRPSPHAWGHVCDGRNNSLFMKNNNCEFVKPPWASPGQVYAGQVMVNQCGYIFLITGRNEISKRCYFKGIVQHKIQNKDSNKDNQLICLTALLMSPSNWKVEPTNTWEVMIFLFIVRIWYFNWCLALFLVYVLWSAWSLLQSMQHDATKLIFCQSNLLNTVVFITVLFIFLISQNRKRKSLKAQYSYDCKSWIK